MRDILLGTLATTLALRGSDSLFSTKRNNRLPGSRRSPASATGQAATLSPHDGDARKLWGGVLAKQGHGKEVLAKYDKAVTYAPHWKQL
jgi:hypothetical protein